MDANEPVLLLPPPKTPQVPHPPPQQLNPEPELTLKQRKWMTIYIETGNATEAAMQVYDCKNRESARSIGSENLLKLDYVDFLELAGVTDKYLVDKLKEGLNSDRMVIVNKKPIRIPDQRTRHQYLETGLKLKRRLVERQEVEETKTININVDALLIKVYGGTTTEPASTP